MSENGLGREENTEKYSERLIFCESLMAMYPITSSQFKWPYKEMAPSNAKPLPKD